ncbi:MAG: fumarylacetoacetate hydrolase family protein, partial [Bacteroidetes bacterium]|nr:fumarylacetoacetate hydrolase family protein [Fibrella sp.]
MHLLYFKTPTGNRLGIQTPTGIIDVDAYCRANNAPEFGLDPVTNDDLAELQRIAQSEGYAFRFPTDSVDRTSCVQRPHKIICIGLNYRKHAVESGMAVPTIPVVFTKYDNTLCHYGEEIPLGAVGEQFDYEVELGVVIGERCKNVSKEEALSKVLGYCVANDLSCRDLQFRSSQWLMGKSLDKFSPLG